MVLIKENSYISYIENVIRFIINQEIIIFSNYLSPVMMRTSKDERVDFFATLFESKGVVLEVERLEEWREGRG